MREDNSLVYKLTIDYRIEWHNLKGDAKMKMSRVFPSI
jgi:hypothetical protein